MQSLLNLKYEFENLHYQCNEQDLEELISMLDVICHNMKLNIIFL